MKTKTQIIENLIRAGHLRLEDALILLDRDLVYEPSVSNYEPVKFNWGTTGVISSNANTGSTTLPITGTTKFRT